MSADRIKIAIWGTGSVGKAAIKLAARRDDLEIVAVKVYSESKDGRDIGEIANIEPLGVTATTSVEEIIARSPDAILYSPMDHGDYRTDGEIQDLLRAGMNIITILPYQNLDVRGPEIVKAFQDAGIEGGATFTATGINPGFISERMALTATGATSEISEVLIDEYLRVGNEPQATLNVFGFGLPAPGEGEKSPAAVAAEGYHRQLIAFIANHFGTPVTDLRYSAEWFLAPHDLITGSMTIPEGTVAYVKHRWDGVTDGGPTITSQVHWYLSDEVRPTDIPCDDFYRITIEGRPSLTIGVEVRGSAKERIRQYAGDETEPAYYLTAAAMLQHVPAVMNAAPGVRKIEPPSNSHWRADMRTALQD